MGITRSKRSWSGIMRISDACVRAQSARLCLLLTPKEGQAGAFSLKRAGPSPGVCEQCSVSFQYPLEYELLASAVERDGPQLHSKAGRSIVVVVEEDTERRSDLRPQTPHNAMRRFR